MKKLLGGLILIAIAATILGAWVQPEQYQMRHVVGWNDLDERGEYYIEPALPNHQRADQYGASHVLVSHEVSSLWLSTGRDFAASVDGIHWWNGCYDPTPDADSCQTGITIDGGAGIHQNGCNPRASGEWTIKDNLLTRTKPAPPCPRP